MLNGYSDRVGLIWQIAEYLRGDYKKFENGKVILPLVVLRRLDCVLADTKAAVLAEAASLEGQITRFDPVLTKVAGFPFYNTSPWDFNKLLGDPENLATNLRKYIGGFSEAAADVLKRFRFDEEITRLDEADLLYLVVGKFAEVDLHPNAVKNHEMGYIYEELIRKFSEQSNETAGEHFTPREVIRLMVGLLLEPDRDVLANGHQRRTLYDPTCGTGGMLSVAEDYLRDLNPDARLEVFGQELNAETYAICRSDMMLKGQDATHIAFDNTLTKDAFPRAIFDYCISNPPFGVDWKKVEKEVRREHGEQGSTGRFGAGLPRINDGSFLFLQHMISKMKPVGDGGSRIAIVFNSSTLTTGEAGSGESEIRRWIIENDWLETVVALPNQLFYNTPLFTFIWVVTNRKAPERRGKVQLIDARDLFAKCASLGEKRKEIVPSQAAEIMSLYRSFEEGDRSRIFSNAGFGTQRVAIDRPLRLRYEIGPLALERLKGDDAWADLDAGLRDRIAAFLTESTATSTTNRDSIRKIIGGLGKIPTAAEKVLWDAVSMRDDTAPIVTDAKGRPVADPAGRLYEDVPLPDVEVGYDDDMATRLATPAYRASIDEFVATEVAPFVQETWVDHSRTKLGYEIPLTRVFYRYAPARDLGSIDADLLALEAEIQGLLAEATS